MPVITNGAVARWVSPFVAALLVGGCSGSTATSTPGAQSATTTTPVATTAEATTPSPTTTLIGGQQVSLRDVEDIEAAVRGYFEAFDTSDLTGLQKHSTGEVKVLAGWQGILMKESDAPPALQPMAANIDSLEIVSVDGNTATVEIKGDLVETTFVYSSKADNDELLTTDISGAVTVVRGTTWQVANFHRQGQWAGDQLYTKVRGQGTGKGVTVKILGVDLRPKGTVLIIGVDNTSSLAAGAINAVIVDTRGKRLLTVEGRNVEILQVAHRSKASKGLLFLKGLPTSARKFTFQIEFILCGNNRQACYVSTTLKFPVQLVQ
jgi:hypothetical protein